MSLRYFNSIYNKYLLFFLSSYMEELKKKSTGVIPGISREDILNIVIPFSPFKDQKRIAEKIDKIMSLCDALEEQIKGGKMIEG